MLITIAQYRTLHVDDNGNEMPIGGTRNGNQSLTAAGASSAMAEGTKLVRIGTDTAVTVNDGGGVCYLPADSVEFFSAVKDQTFTFATV